MPEGMAYKNVQLPSGEIVAFPGDMPDAEINKEVRKYLALAPSEPEAQRVNAPPAGASLAEILSWRQDAMGDLGRAEPQTPEEIGAATRGAGIGLAVAGGIGTAGGVIPAISGGIGGLVANQVTEYGLRKLGLPEPIVDVVGFGAGMFGGGSSAAVGTGLRGAVKRFLLKRLGVKQVEAATVGAGAGAEGKTIGDLIEKTLGDPKPIRIESMPQWVTNLGSKAERAWLESRGHIPGAMGPDDVLAMKARGATAEEVEAALLRAQGVSQGVGWVKQGTIKAPAANAETTVAGASSAEEIANSILIWKKTHRLSDPQIVSALREVHGVQAKDARALLELMSGG